MTAPLYFSWDGEAMRPLAPKAADRAYVVGERYRLAVEEERSGPQHRMFFASVNEAFKNLPEGSEYQSADALRKAALIQAGFYDEDIIDCGTPDVAERVAAMVAKMDDFAVTFVRDHFVVRRRAKSQSTRAMKKDEFKRSVDAVLEIISAMVGVTPADLQANADAAA